MLSFTVIHRDGEQWIFVYDNYVKKKSCKRRILSKFSSVNVPASSAIMKLVKEVFKLGLSYTRNSLLC